MSGCDWQKKKFSVSMGSLDNYNKIFKKSKCCNAPVKVDGRTTHYYVCTKCNKSCDIRGFYDDVKLIDEVLNKENGKK